MAVRRVRGVSRVGADFISGLCNPGEDWQYRGLEDVADDIESGTHVYLTAEGTAEPARIHVVHGQLGPYLRTDPDTSRKNNLEDLPSCAALQAQGPQRRIMPTVVRRNIATVSRAERLRLRDAILKLNSRFYPLGNDPVSIWFKQDQIHERSHVHQQASFLAFHRFLVNEFEAQLQKIDPGLALHYWDWTTDPRRAPNGRGGAVNLMTSDLMGASDGPLGAPFLKSGFYKPDPPNRDFDEMGKPQPKKQPELPPSDVARAVLSTGRAPIETTYDDVQELYDDLPRTRRPREDQPWLYRISPDADLVGVKGRPGVEFERFWRALYISHGVAHRYLGKGLRPDGSSFEDPFVYLLHSNVDRLWASWQLRADHVDHRSETSFRLDPDYVYGQLIDGRVERPDFSVAGRDPASDTEAEYNERRREVGAAAKEELTSDMPPFSGVKHPNYGESVLPWTIKPHLVTPQSPEVLRPPLYDRYVGDGPLCMAWPTLRLGRQLPRGDIIHLGVDEGAVAASDVEFVLEAGPGVFWWKGLRLPDGTLLEVEDNMMRSSAVLRLGQVHGGTELVFHKLITLFVFATGRRIVYRLGDLSWIPGGSRLTFYWDDDSDDLL